MTRIAYRQIQVIFCLLLLLLVAYLCMGYIWELSMPCYVLHHTGVPCVSCGANRVGMLLLRGDLEAAFMLNSCACYIYLFFALQLIFRIVFLTLSWQDWMPLSTIIRSDIVLSSIVFVGCYSPMMVRYVESIV